MIHLPHIVGETWFNSEPLTPEDLKDKVVLVDFWTYTCVNCQRTLPYIKEWYEKYKDHGLVIIGIHTPEFEFEKDPENVKQAIKDLDIPWPIVLDNDKKNWDAFANKYWPAKYVADKTGKIVYEHAGEGQYEETEKKIRALLDDKTLPDMDMDEHLHGKVCFIPTPETYLGYYRGKLAKQAYVEDRESTYTKPDELPLHSTALNGTFFTSAEFVESKEENAEVLLHFIATEVNVVLEPIGKRAIVDVRLNGEPLQLEIKGNDVAESGEVLITKSRMYNLIRANEEVEGELSIRALEGNFRAYVFTFSGCVE